MDTIEKKVAEAITQEPTDIQIGEKTYKFYPPTLGTIIKASEIISTLPKIELDTDRLLEGVLYTARDCKAIAQSLAVLILGERNLKRVEKHTKIIEKKYLFGLIKKSRYVTTEEVIDAQGELEREINNLTPKELNNIYMRVLMRADIADFFGITTFLIGVNLLKPTKVDN